MIEYNHLTEEYISQKKKKKMNDTFIYFIHLHLVHLFQNLNMLLSNSEILKICKIYSEIILIII